MKNSVKILISLVVLVVLLVASLTLGRYKIGPITVLRALLSPIFPNLKQGIPEIERQLILMIRLPRILGAMLIGAGFAGSGTALQAIFQNPLVDSNILGVTSGAGFGAALSLLFMKSAWEVQLTAFIFGLIAVLIAFFGSRLYKTTRILVLTLMGILVGSLFNSLISLLKYVADPLDTLPAITFWLLGSLTGVTWKNMGYLAITIMIGLIFLIIIRWRLNVLSLNDQESQSLGGNPTKMKLAVIIVSTLMTAAAVSVSGVIGWIGLIIPHAGRLFVGPDHKYLVPISMIFGGIFLLLVDNIARTLLPGEIPLGVLTGLIGAPILIFLLRRNRTGW